MIRFSTFSEEEQFEYDTNEENDFGPVLVPCDTEECDGLIMDYDEDEDVYICPNCGREVRAEDVVEYLASIAES